MRTYKRFPCYGKIVVALNRGEREFIVNGVQVVFYATTNQYLKATIGSKESGFNEDWCVVLEWVEQMVKSLREEFGNLAMFGKEREWRWENEKIGQGHYYGDLTACIKDVVTVSEWNLLDTFKVEMYKPQRMTLCKIRNGREI